VCSSRSRALVAVLRAGLGAALGVGLGIWLVAKHVAQSSTWSRIWSRAWCRAGCRTWGRAQAGLCSRLRAGLVPPGFYLECCAWSSGGYYVDKFNCIHAFIITTPFEQSKKL